MLPTKFWFIVQAISDPRGKDFLEIDQPEARNSYAAMCINGSEWNAFRGEDSNVNRQQLKICQKIITGMMNQKWWQ